MVKTVAETKGKTVKIVDVVTGRILAEYEMASGGNHVSDQGKVYVRTPKG